MTTLAKHLLRESAVSEWMRNNYVVIFKIASYGVMWGNIRKYLNAFYDIGGADALGYAGDLALMRLEIGFPIWPPTTMDEAVLMAQDVTTHYTIRDLFKPVKLD